MYNGWYFEKREKKTLERKQEKRKQAIKVMVYAAPSGSNSD